MHFFLFFKRCRNFYLKLSRFFDTKVPVGVPFTSNVRGKKDTKVEISISTPKPFADSFRTIRDNKKIIRDWSPRELASSSSISFLSAGGFSQWKDLGISSNRKRLPGRWVWNGSPFFLFPESFSDSAVKSPHCMNCFGLFHARYRMVLHCLTVPKAAKSPFIQNYPRDAKYEKNVYLPLPCYL